MDCCRKREGRMRTRVRIRLYSAVYSCARPYTAEYRCLRLYTDARRCVLVSTGPAAPVARILQMPAPSLRVPLGGAPKARPHRPVLIGPSLGTRLISAASGDTSLGGVPHRVRFLSGSQPDKNRMVFRFCSGCEPDRNRMRSGSNPDGNRNGRPVADPPVGGYAGAGRIIFGKIVRLRLQKSADVRK